MNRSFRGKFLLSVKSSALLYQQIIIIQAIILAKDDATTKTIGAIESEIRSLKTDLSTFKGQVPSGLAQSAQRPSSRSNDISNSEVETFLAAITSENKNIEGRVLKKPV